MNSEIFSAFFALPAFIWQSTFFIIAGLIGSFILRRRSARAHQVLLLSVIAAVTVPGMSELVRHLELGLLTVKPTVRRAAQAEILPATFQEAPAIAPATAEIPPEPIVQATTSVAPQNSSHVIVIPWRKVIMCSWLIAMLILLSRLIICFLQGVRLLGRALPMKCGKLRESINQARTKLGIDIDLEICSSHGVPSPVIWCWSRRPILLIPAEAGRLNERIDWAGVLCHELAHFKRRDCRHRPIRYGLRRIAARSDPRRANGLRTGRRQ